MAARPTNPELCEAFRDLLTRGFYGVNEDGEVLDADKTLLAATKPWRGELWTAFLELEERLCPPQARNRRFSRSPSSSTS